MEAGGPECQRVKLYLKRISELSISTREIPWMCAFRIFEDWSEMTEVTRFEKTAQFWPTWSVSRFFHLALSKTILGNHDMQQAFNMRSYESDFNEVEDEDVYNLLLARDRPDLEEAKQKPPKLTEIILS